MGQWLTALILFLVWFVLRAVFHKGGMVHVILLSSIAVFVVQLAAVRKTRYHQSLSRRSSASKS
jgi:hypothetical protein